MKYKFQDLIVYEDDHFGVINKPAFMASMEDRGGAMDVQRLAKQHDSDWQVCHRLDKETSGCLLIAKNEAAYRHASIQFEKRSIEKTYLAVAHGQHEFKSKEIDAPIAALPKGLARIDQRNGKPARTIVTTQELFRKHTLFSCQPVTGRMHQIRLHLAMLGAPLVNDPLYKGAPLYLSELKRKFNLKKDTEERPLIQRFALHASALTFHNMEAQVRVEAELPKDMAVLLKQLKKYHSNR